MPNTKVISKLDENNRNMTHHISTKYNIIELFKYLNDSNIEQLMLANLSLPQKGDMIAEIINHY